jgi:hypothetical protein
MTSLQKAVQDYVSLRQSLGFKLRCVRLHLLRFAAFAEARGAEYVTTSLALEWAMQPANLQPASWVERMKAIRVFARYQHVLDPRTEIPPPGLLPYRPQRTKPYVYSVQEIERLVKATRRPRSSVGLKPHTYSCLLDLLAVSDWPNQSRLLRWGKDSLGNYRRKPPLHATALSIVLSLGGKMSISPVE